jgi:glutamate-1-semialdehyde aminotransferase/spore coat polysaccharide biosynthesis protein SpsF (cytidylyltransferase family)
MTKVVCVIQARLGSTRLPGKVLMDLGGHPVLEWCMRACQATPGVSECWIATSTLPQDDAIAEFCDDHGFFCWRGSETDVLSRFVGCANANGADVLLRLTGDCPFLDPQVIGAVVRLQKQSGAAFVTNVSPRTYPDGLDVQSFTREALMAADADATRPLDRDGVCTWIERNRSRFPAETVINPIPVLQDERWVLDTADDLEFCKAIVARWPWDRGPPSQLDILGILDASPELREINKHHPCNERYFDALAEEPIYARTYERSQAQFKKAREVIPLAAQTFSKSYLQYPQPSPLFLSHGQGSLVWDVDGNEYVDLVSALLPNVLGYRDPDVDAAIRRQTNSGISFSLATELEAELAETLCRLIPCAEAVRFGKSGTDVTSAAIRLARAYTGRDRILICGGYHGWQDWSVDRNLGVPDDVRRLTTRVSLADISPNMASDYAACIIEPECGASTLQFLRDWCSRHGTILIFDEVITGFRFDLGGAQKLYGVTPDLATFGKAMANGMPLSAVVGRKDIMKRFEPPDNIFYSGTMFGETLSLAASIATIKKLERDKIIQRIWRCGAWLADEVRNRLDWHGMETTIQLHGSDVFKRLKFRNDQIAALFRKEMVASGTLITASHNISAAHGPSEIKRILKSYDHALGVVRQAVEKGDIAERLNGASVAPLVRAS